MKVLTKSRFKLGLECPNKLFYTQKEEYPSTKKEDTFLESLAQGGFQVEELARIHYPDGILIEGNDWDYGLLWNQTLELLKNENVIIYEAAFLIEGLFVRTDILVKRGANIELIEVKAKSFDPDDDYLFIGKRGGMVSDWKPYLFDIAFQKHVVGLCFPEWKVQSFIMMADKSKKASINGLNQLFRISNKVENRTGIEKKVDSIEEVGTPILGRKNVSSIVKDIEEEKYRYYDNLGFKESISMFKDLYMGDIYANWPTSYSMCKNCEYRCSDSERNIGLKSGFRECFIKQHNWTHADFSRPNIFDIYDFRKGTALMNEGILFKSQLTKENIGFKPDHKILTTSHRQWLQIEKEVINDHSIFVDPIGLKNEIEKWQYPLHFIDFETSAVALPFNIGLAPYEQVAFQFSHHKYNNDKSVEHYNQYINTEAGLFPNFEFIRSLKRSLEIDSGTILRYSNHENTILNAIYNQLHESNEQDKEELMLFIQSISHSTKSSSFNWKGDRDMVDLWEIEKKYYYNPLTKGSNSIKAVLPAALNSSKYLKQKYSNPIGQIDVTSKNLPTDHIWIQMSGNTVINPYDLLPSVFESWSEEQLEQTLSEIEDIANGGAALIAYSKLQYVDMSENERSEIVHALLKYCELDTLAMVMIFEHFMELIDAEK